LDRPAAELVRASALSAHCPTMLRQSATAQATCLSSCLIHPHPRPFTSGHPGRVRAGHGRWRTSVNAGQHWWKACWGQPLASSNLASSATLTCNDALGSCCALRYIPTHVSHFLSQLSPGHMSHSGQTGVVACWDDSRCTWSGTSRTYLNGTAHAAESCAGKLPGRARTARLAHGMPLPKVFKATSEPPIGAAGTAVGQPPAVPISG
jgi:hypothetical protein